MVAEDRLNLGVRMTTETKVKSDYSTRRHKSLRLQQKDSRSALGLRLPRANKMVRTACAVNSHFKQLDGNLRRRLLNVSLKGVGAKAFAVNLRHAHTQHWLVEKDQTMEACESVCVCV